MTTRVYKNFVEGTLASGIAGTGTTSMSVTFATNATVPVSSDFTSKHIYFVIDPEGAEHAPEVVKGTAISGSGPYDITIARSQNGTTPQVWDSGRKVVAALIEEDITNFATKDGTTFTGDVTIPDGDLILASTAVTSTAAELNILDGCTATYTELNIMDGVTATTAEINYLDDDDLTAADLTKLAAITADATEINVLDGVTGGTVTASKALVVDGNKDLASLRNVTLTGELDAATLDISGVVDIDGDVDITANLAFTGTLSGSNSIPVVAYSHGGAASVASNQVNDTPQIFVCTGTPTTNLTDGDIWFDIS